jgi:hypothetical protein
MNNGILDGGGGGQGYVQQREREVGLWDMAWSWAKTVGEKVVEGEEEMWRRINGAK